MKKVTIAIMAILTVGIISFVSCNKDNETINSGNIPAKTTGNPGNGLINIATCDVNTGLASLNFCVDIATFESYFNQLLADSLGQNFIFNDLYIIDDNVGNSNEIPYLALSIVDVATGETETQFAKINKVIENNTVQYCTNGEGLNIVVCTGHNCTNGCYLNAERTGCTDCQNQDGTCSTFALHISLGDLISKALELIQSLS